MPQSVLASELQKKMEQEFSSGQLNQESGELQRHQEDNNYDSNDFEENEIKIFEDNQKDEKAYGTDEEDALLNQFPDKNQKQLGSPAKSSKEVRDSKNSVGSKGSNKITPKRGNQYIKNAFENNAVPRIPGDKKNYNLKQNQVVRLEKLNNKYVNNVGLPKQKQLNSSQINKSVKKMRGAEDVDSQHIERLQNWYQNRVSPSPGSTILPDDQQETSNGAPATNLDYRNMLAHYQQHMNNLKDQQEFLKHLSSSDQIEFKVPNNLAKKVQRPAIGGMKSQAPGANNTNLPSITGPQINVHQHFNQANITNFNQNAFYVSDTKSSQEPFMYRKPSMGDENRQGAKSHGGPNGVKRGGKRRLVPSIQQKSDEDKKLKSRHTQQNAKSWGTQEEQPGSARKNSSQVALQGIKEFSPFDEGSAAEADGSQGVMSIQGAGSLEDGGTDAPNCHTSKEGLPPTTSIDQAIHAQAKFFNQRSLAQKALRRAAGPGVIPLTLLPSGINRNQGPTLSFKNFGSLDRAAYASQRSMIGKFSPTHNPYALQQNGKRRVPDQKKFGFDGMNREDLQDQLLLVKSQLNNANDELTKTKTRNAILQQQLKEKDKFIDELLKSTYLMNQALVSNNEQLAAEKQGGAKPSTNNDESAQAYQQFLEKGPYSVLKLKKKVADLKELLANKTHEHAELERNIKQRKILELQKEIRLYSRECQKLRDITSHTLDVIRKNGLEAELDSHAPSKAAAKMRSSSAAISANHDENKSQKSGEQVEQFQELTIKNSQKSQQLIQSGVEKDKIASLNNKVQKLEQEKSQLQEKVQNLQANVSVYTDKKVKNSKNQSRLSIDNLTKADKPKDSEEFQKESPTLKQRVAQLEKEKEVIERHLNQEKNINSLMSKKIEVLENQSKQVKKSDQSQQLQQSNVLLLKAKEEKIQQQKQIDRQAAEIKTLKKQIETQKAHENKQSKAVSKQQNIPIENKKEVEKLSKNLELAKKEADEQKKQILAYRNQVNDKENRIQELEKQLKKVKSEKPAAASAQQANQKKVTVNTKVTPGTKQRSMTTKAQDSQNIKKNPAKSEDKEENLTQSSVVNSQLEKERQMIEQKILNVKESDYDERSDLQFSQMQSQIPGITSSEISGVPTKQEPFVAYQTPYQLHNDTIKEEMEEHDQTKHMKGQKQTFDQKAPEDINKEIASVQNSERKTQPPAGKDYLTLGKQKLSASEVVLKQPRKMTVGQKDGNQLVEQLDRIPSESNIDDSHPGSTVVPRGTVKNLKFVEFEDHSVQLGFKRLGRALQLKRLQLDQIESVVPGNEFQANQSISIAQLTRIFEQTLALGAKEATNFARFLIEEKDEDRPDITTIDFDPNRQVNSQYIPVRLMTRFLECPATYDSKQEEQVKLKFNKAFDQSQAKRFVKKLNEQEEAIVSFDHFKGQIQSQNEKNALTDSDIECAFLLLCRGTSDPKKMSEFELSEKVQGFDSQNIHLLFGPDSKEESDEYSEEEYDKDSIVNSDKTKSINESLPEELSKSKNQGIDQTFRSKQSPAKSDDYENDFEEEAIPDDVSDNENNNEKAPEKEKAAGDSSQVAKTAKFGDQNLLEGKKEETKPSKDEEKDAAPGADFTFKNESMDQKDKHEHQVNDDDRSENDFEQQESMNPEQLDQFKFGNTHKETDMKYKENEKEIIREQSRENLEQENQDVPKEEHEKFELPLDSERPKEPPKAETAEEKQKAEPDHREKTEEKDDGGEYEYYDEEDPEEKPAQEAPEQSSSPINQAQIQKDLEQDIAQRMGAEGLEELKIQGGEEEQKEEMKQEEKVEEKLQKPGQVEQHEQIGPVKFTSDQIAQLNEALFQILNKKMKDENLYNHIDQTQVNQIINTSSGLFQHVGGIILHSFSELADSCRDIFREIIYSEVVAAGTFATKTSNTSLNIPVKNETEVLKIEEFIFKMEELLHPTKLTPQQASGLQILLTLKAHQGHILYTDVASIFKPLEIKDYKVPKGQSNSQQLNYDILDLRSVRLINRMIHYLGSSQEEGTHKQVSFSDFMSDIVERQAVKTKSGSKDAEIFLAKRFFQKLYDAGIKKNNLIHPNLCIFLCIDQKYKNYLMLKKLKRMIIDFNQSMYFQSVGLKKQKLQEDADGYEYYDEEDNAQSIQAQSQPPQSVVNDINASSQRNMSNMKLPNQSSGDQPNAADNDDAAQYEYYDEEDPDAIEKASAKIQEQSKEVEKIKAQALQHAQQPPAPAAEQPVGTAQSPVVAAPAASAPPAADVKHTSNPNVVIGADGNEYEYYDEEDEEK